MDPKSSDCPVSQRALTMLAQPIGRPSTTMTEPANLSALSLPTTPAYSGTKIKVFSLRSVMFATSSQLKSWLFSGETELAKCRAEGNFSYVASQRSKMTDQEVAVHFLTPQEERILSRQYEVVLRKFCAEFQPPMPKCVIGTSLSYFKRFYVHNSNMDFHPKDIMLTCVYLACKVEEFYVPIGQFVKNLRGDREKFADAILSFELTLMSKLNYNLTVHNPFRPLEGFLIDIKTHCPGISNVERIRRPAEEFLERSLLSDACLIFSPSQIALAAVKFGAAKERIVLDGYIKDTLLKTASEKEAENTLYQLQRVKYIVKGVESVPREQAQAVQKKLDSCRNPDNNPDSDVYKQRMLEKVDEEEDVKAKKRPRLSENNCTDLGSQVSTQAKMKPRKCPKK